MRAYKYNYIRKDVGELERERHSRHIEDDEKWKERKEIKCKFYSLNQTTIPQIPVYKIVRHFLTVQPAKKKTRYTTITD
jgi:hypothetical protein